MPAMRDASQDGRPVRWPPTPPNPGPPRRPVPCASCSATGTIPAPALRPPFRETCDATGFATGRYSSCCWSEPLALYRSSHLLATSQERSHFYYLNGGTEIARVEVPGWLAQDPELLALGHAMLVQQCELGFGYPVAVSEAHEQAVITGHDREEFRRLTLMLLEQQGLPTPESAKSFPKRRPWV